MKTICLNVEKEYECDVLVVGGGCAGFSAAVCAARQGVKVILAERNGYLGGTATSGLVGPFMTSFDAYGEKQLIKGFFDEFVTRMEQMGGAVHPSKGTVNSAYSSYREKGHRKLSQFDAESYKYIAEKMCVESNAQLLYHTVFLSAEVLDGKITAAYFSTQGGIIKIKSKVFIDCSGEAVLAKASGVEIIYGNKDGYIQSASLFFTVKGVDKQKMDARMKSIDDIREKFYMDTIIEARKNGEFPSNRAKIQLFEAVNGEWLVNMTQIDNVDAYSSESVTSAEIEGREQTRGIVEFLKKYVAGCENITLSKTADSLGIRESGHILGEYILTVEDAVNSTKFEDSVFCCSNSIDIHTPNGVKYIERKTNEPYYFPYRSLVAKGVENLLVAGRCASAESEIMAAVRVMPPCFAMGQAAGLGAVLAVEDNIACAKIDIKKLKEKLDESNVVL